MPLEPESDLHWTAFLYVSGRARRRRGGSRSKPAWPTTKRPARRWPRPSSWPRPWRSSGPGHRNPAPDSRRDPPGARPGRVARGGGLLAVAWSLAFRSVQPAAPDPSEVADGLVGPPKSGPIAEVDPSLEGRSRRRSARRSSSSPTDPTAETSAERPCHPGSSRPPRSPAATPPGRRTEPRCAPSTRPDPDRSRCWSS